MNSETSCRQPPVWIVAGIAGLILAANSAGQVGGAETTLAILPEKIALVGRPARQRLVVELVRDGKYVGQLSEGLVFEMSDPKVAVVRDGFALPVGDGKTKLTVRSADKTATAEIQVVAADQPVQWSFRNHVQSVLAKAGCSSGACHGAAAGKKGFKLSLRGYDPDGDYNVLTRQARGRRVTLSDPGRSLMLIKPTATIAHGGGERFPLDSLEYKVLSEWIAAGAPPPKPDDPRIDRIEMLPAASILKPKGIQQLLVRAYFSDGHWEDVTHWAKYSATNLEVAGVDEDGQVNVMGEGEGAVTAWYLNQLAVASVTVPYERTIPPQLLSGSTHRNVIDERVFAKLKDLNLPASLICTDPEFLRRAFLDTIGVLPTSEEARTFLADASPQKRDKLIEHLLDRPEFVDYWSHKLSDLLLVSSDNLHAPAMWAYYNWIRHQVAANTRWDQFVRELVMAQGSTLENGATNFFAMHTDPRELTETISLAFLGMAITCARCHNHPLEKWSNDQYYGMVSLVSRVRRKNAPGDGHFTVFSDASGEFVQPLSGKPQPPRPLDGNPVPADDPTDRRVHLANWLTSAQNPYFTRAIVNRVWANFLGVGLVEKVDDLRLTNPASNDKLLASLCGFLVDNQYNLKALMRAILQSNTYQRSSVPVAGNAKDKRFYSRYQPRRLSAEVLLDAISQVTGVPTKFPDYPEGWRALQLPDSKVASSFLDTFGRNDRAITCECSRSNEPSTGQVLHIANGETVNQKLRAKNNRLDQWLADKLPTEKIVEEAYLGSLSRHPTDSEKQQLLKVLGESGEKDQRQLLEDLCWSILSSKEFLFNH